MGLFLIRVILMVPKHSIFNSGACVKDPSMPATMIRYLFSLGSLGTPFSWAMLAATVVSRIGLAVFIFASFLLVQDCFMTIVQRLCMLASITASST